MGAGENGGATARSMRMMETLATARE